jgi:hypothetical protein
MSTATLTAPVRVNTSGVHAPPRLGRLVAVELRKMLNTRAGLWLQVAIVALTAFVVLVRVIAGNATDHTSPPSSPSGCSRRPSCCRSPASCSSHPSGPSAPA